MKKLLLLSLLAFRSLSAQANDCTVDIYKTYTPRTVGIPVCDDKNLPASFAGDLASLAQGLRGRGYKAKQYDQCANGTNDSATYALVSQLGDCVQMGAAMNCKLYVGLYENATNHAVYENSIQGTGLFGVSLHLSDALASLPECNSL